LPTYGGLYVWEFEKRGRKLKVRVEGQLVFNNLAPQSQHPADHHHSAGISGPRDRQTR
jgi:hypothetical protein